MYENFTSNNYTEKKEIGQQRKAMEKEVCSERSLRK